MLNEETIIQGFRNTAIRENLFGTQIFSTKKRFRYTFRLRKKNKTSDKRF